MMARKYITKVFFVLFTALFVKVTESVNLLQNGDLETEDYWSCDNCEMQLSNDRYHGNYSALITNSSSGEPGLSQKIAVTPGMRYVMKGYIKLKKMSQGVLYNRIEMASKVFRSKDLPHPVIPDCRDTITQCHLIPNTCDDLVVARTICRKTCNLCDPDTTIIGELPMVQEGYGWIEIGGDFLIPTDVRQMTLYFHIYGNAADYLVDYVSVVELPRDDTWKQEANDRINKIRKSDIMFTLRGQKPGDSYEIEVEQVKHEFAFGSAVTAMGLTNTSLTKYQKFFFDNFNWAVLENALKWSKMEKTRGTIDYETPRKALEILNSKGIPVRGHTVFWDVATWGVQPWVAMLSKEELIKAMEIRYEVVNFTLGKVKHWDVNNENNHGGFYESRLGDANITMKMFERVHHMDPDVQLFLNDFGVVTADSAVTVALKNQATILKKSGVPIHGVGIQSHLYSDDLDIPAMKYRIDKVAEAGLPLFITELTYNQGDVQKRAQGYHDVLTLYFSHPSVEGILLWGFWDEMLFQVNASIVTGPDLTPNAAGEQVLKLLNDDWRTNTTFTMRDNGVHTLRGFHGDYTLRVKQNGSIIMKKDFVLDKNGTTIHIQLDTSSDPHSVGPQIIVG